MDKNIYVTKPFLPPIKEYIELLEEIWSNEMLTNNGPIVSRFEKELLNRTKVKNLVSVANATLGLELALKALNIMGEVITTPFTFYATLTSIMRHGATPVFADIDPDTFNIDPKKIEEKITDKTSAILAVHVFSNPCDIEAIEDIARKYNLKVIYDSAHAMFVDYKDRSILEYGDISVVSFHATKLFNTVEGGACITKDEAIAEELKSLRNFGIDKNGELPSVGTNAKISELHGAMGLLNLKYIDEILEDRTNKYQLYRSILEKNHNLGFQKINQKSYNYSYMPILFKNEEELLKALEKLNKNNVFPRRYFYPSLNKLSCLEKPYQSLPISEDIASRILCLPLYNSLSFDEIKYICDLLK